MTEQNRPNTLLDTEIRLLQAEDLSLEDAAAAVEDAIGRWSEVHELLLRAIHSICSREADAGKRATARLAIRLFDAIQLEPTIGAVGIDVVCQLLRAQLHDVEPLVRWAVGVAEPGDAHHLVDLLWDEDIPADLQNLIGGWLLDHGHAELRSSTQQGIAAKLVALFADAGDLSSTKRALTVTLRNERALSHDLELTERLLKGLELIVQTDDDLDLFEDVIQKLGPTSGSSLQRLLLSSEQRDTWSRRIQLILARGRLPSGTQTSWWFAVAKSGEARIDRLPAGCFAPTSGALSALALRRDLQLGDLSERVPDGQLRGWGRLLAQAYAARPEPGLPESQLRLALDRREDVKQGAREGFLAAMEAEFDPELANNVREVFATSSGKGALDAAMHLIATAHRARPAVEQTRDLELLERGLSRLMRSDWGSRLGGFDLSESASWIRAVKIEELDEDLPIEQRNDTLVVRAAVIRAIWDLSMKYEERLALVEMFVVHELVHLRQGIGQKSTVTKLRGHGLAGETTLLHLDLGADHVAACALAHAKYADQLLWLKDLQGKSLQAFKVGSHHGFGSRYRKSLRLLALRVDLIAREQNLLGRSPDSGSYAFCDVGAWEVLVLQSGPPVRVMRSFAIAEADRQNLEMAASKEDGVALVDRILRRGFRVG